MSGAGVLPKTQGAPKTHVYSWIHSKNLSSASCWWVIVTHFYHTHKHTIWSGIVSAGTVMFLHNVSIRIDVFLEKH